MAVAFAVVVAFGWLLGLLSAGIALWRSAREKRRLRQDLKYAEAELRTRQGLDRDPTLDDVFLDATGRTRSRVAGDVQEVK